MNIESPHQVEDRIEKNFQDSFSQKLARSASKSMDAYENLANNLRRLCKTKSSISKVCEDIDINRQQFSRYLSGETIPRKETLQKICNYFDVNSVQLFLPPDASVGSPSESALLSNPDFLSAVKQAEAPQSLPLEDGYYLTYFRPKVRGDWIVRSLVAIKTERSVTTFRRLTGYGEKLGSTWRLSLGHHRGVVLNRRGFMHFAGMDKLGSQIPTMMVLQWTPTKFPMLKGQSTVLTTTGSEICDVVMEPLSETNLRAAIRRTGAIGINETILPKRVKQVFMNM